MPGPINDLEEPSAPPARVVLCTVGGSPAPILHTLRALRPACVWYVFSPETREVVDAIHAQLDWHPDRDLLPLDRFEELGPCYRVVRGVLPGLLAKWRVDPAEVVVDYTGGTKTMSAALVLAATELFHRFSYVGGARRDKDGVGTVLDGCERSHYQANPWADLAVREIDRAARLWDHLLLDAAADILDEAAARVPHPARLGMLALAARGLAARHRLDFKSATADLRKAASQATLVFDGRDDHGLVAALSGAADITTACSKGDGPTLLRELLDNALRTAGQGRFEDAAARLYRAMELDAQLRLEAATGGAIAGGRVDPAKPLPPALADWPPCRPREDGSPARLAQEACHLALARLGDPASQAVAADIDAGNHSRWRRATRQRNASILAHGTDTIGEKGFATMQGVATDLLAFDLGREHAPFPQFHPGWAEA